MEQLRANSSSCENVPQRFRLERDPDDEIYVNLALAVDAEYLVTRDKDLLSLMEETEAGREFRSRFPSLQVVDPVAFLRIVDERLGVQRPSDEW